MVKYRDNQPVFQDSSFDLSLWLKEIEETFADNDSELITKACLLAEEYGATVQTPLQVSCFEQGLTTADTLYALGLDSETIAAGMLNDCFRYAKVSETKISKNTNQAVAQLILGVNKMQSLHTDHKLQQTENLRRLLLAVVEDLRVVLLSLAVYTTEMRAAIHSNDEIRKRYAKDAREIYVPLANRLGIGQIKWELEDLAFRFLEPQAYKQIAQFLHEKRVDREQFIFNTITEIEQALRSQGIQAEVTGRAKHIYSIWKKMQRKGVGYHEIYDLHAIRILTTNVSECYAALGVVHGLWRHIPKEFDDYIANPKTNGYRSLHTAVIGPEGKIIEVQIRTKDMHKQSELGVAAHWRYKEGIVQDEHYETKLAQLRQILKWQEDWVKDVSDNGSGSGSQSGNDSASENYSISGHDHDSDGALNAAFRAEVFHDRVYVLTPKGRVMDLSAGATVLDFAYHVHSEIGNHCRGAKVNGRMVPLTTMLKSGDKVEILTSQKSGPSRDWLNPHFGYLSTVRARSKVLHWFKRQDRDQNVIQGREHLERELQRLGLDNINYESLAEKLKMPNVEDMLAGIGSGSLRLGQLLNAIQSFAAPLSPKRSLSQDESMDESVIHTKRKTRPAEITVAGVGNLLCQIARCCKPLPGDEIIGYLAMGRGVSVHRKDCVNILQAKERQISRLIHVAWGEETHNLYSVEVIILAHDRQGLIRDITSILANEHVNVSAIRSRSMKDQNRVTILLSLEISGIEVLSKIFTRLQQLPNIISIRRDRGQAPQ